MKIDIQGDILLDEDVRQDIAGAPDRILGRLGGRIAELSMRIEPVARGGKTLCQVTVRMADRIQVLASDRSRDTRSAVVNALGRAKLQVARSLRKRRKRLTPTMSMA